MLVWQCLSKVQQRWCKSQLGVSYKPVDVLQVIFNQFLFSRFDQFLGDEHKEHMYNRGTKCWNGPERSVHAKFECGGETEIIEVTEPEKCEYRYRLKTPAVCPLPDELKQEAKENRPVHEEL